MHIKCSCVCECNTSIIKYFLRNNYFSEIEHVSAFTFSQFLQNKLDTELSYFFQATEILSERKCSHFTMDAALQCSRDT